MALKLSAVVEGLRWSLDNELVFINIETHKILNCASPTFSDIPNDKILDEVEANKDKYIELPLANEINQRKIAIEFVLSLDEGIVRDNLSKSLNNITFKKFYKLLDKYEYKDKWIQFRAKALKEIAISFLNSKNIEFENDVYY